MVWFKVDDSFYDHPKTEELSDSAVALWTRAGSYCAKHLTDGFITHRKADRMCDNPATAITELVEAGLWEKDADGYRFHDWHEYQPTREEALATSKAKSLGGAVGNHRRWHVERGKPDPECPYCKAEHRSTDRITDQSTESPPIPPTRPDPTYIQPPTEVAAEGLFEQPAKTDTKTRGESQDEPTLTQRAFGVARDWIKYRQEQSTPIVAKGKTDPAVILRKLIEPFLEKGYSDTEVKHGLIAVGESIPSTASLDRTLTRLRNQQNGRMDGGMKPANNRILRNSHENQDRYDVKL